MASRYADKRPMCHFSINRVTFALLRVYLSRINEVVIFVQ